MIGPRHRPLNVGCGTFVLQTKERVQPHTDGRQVDFSSISSDAFGRSVRTPRDRLFMD